MRAYNRGLRDAVDLIRLYGDENIRMCDDTVRLDPLYSIDSSRAYTKAEIDEMTERSDILSLHGAGHSAVYHACKALAGMVLAMRKRDAP